MSQPPPLPKPSKPIPSRARFLSLGLLASGFVVWSFWFNRHLLRRFLDLKADPQTLVFALVGTSAAVLMLAKAIKILYPELPDRLKEVARSLPLEGRRKRALLWLWNTAGLLALFLTSSVYILVDKDAAQEVLAKSAGSGPGLTEFEVEVLQDKRTVWSGRLAPGKAKLRLFFPHFRPLSVRIRRPDLYEPKPKALHRGQAAHLSVPSDFVRRKYYGIWLEPGPNLQHLLPRPESGDASAYELRIKSGNRVLYVERDLRLRPLYLGPGEHEIRIIVAESGGPAPGSVFRSVPVQPGDEIVFELAPTAPGSTGEAPRVVGRYKAMEPGMGKVELIDPGPPLRAPTHVSPSGLSIPEGISHPRIAVVAEIPQNRLHLSSSQIVELKSILEQKFVENARETFPCMDWLAGQPVPGTPLQGILTIELIESELVRSPRLLLSYRQRLAGGTAGALSRGFNQVVLDTSEYWGFALLKDRISERLDDQFLKEDFVAGFDSDFIANVPIAGGVGFEGGQVVVLVESKSLSLALDSPLFVLLRAPLCQRRPQDCKIDLASQGELYGGRWPGALACRLGGVSCCPSISWQSLVDGTGQAERLAVFLSKEHGHSKLSIDGLARHPGTP